MKSNLLIFCLMLMCTPPTQAQKTITDPRDNSQYAVTTLNGQEWFTKNIDYQSAKFTSYCPDETDCSAMGRFYYWADTAQICPEGWRLPSYQDLLILISRLDGKPNALGGKLVPQAAIADLDVKMVGLYLSSGSENPLRARGAMEIWLSSSDTLWNNPDPEFEEYNGHKVIGLHLYGQANDSLTIEPTYIKSSSSMRLSCRCIKSQYRDNKR